MTVSVFAKGTERPRFTAWEPVQRMRKMDLSWGAVAVRESRAKYFHEGWDERLAQAGFLISIQDFRLPTGVIWMVDCVGAADYLGCTLKSMCKNIETMRHFRRITGDGIYDILQEHGFFLRENFRHMEVSVVESPRSCYCPLAFAPPPVVASPPAQAPPATAEPTSATIYLAQAQTRLAAPKAQAPEAAPPVVPCTPLSALYEPVPPQVEYFAEEVCDDFVVDSPMDVSYGYDRMAVASDSCFELPVLPPSFCEEMWSF